MKRFYRDVEVAAAGEGHRVLLEANPLADVDAWSRIDQVILHGEPIDRETLAAH